MNSGLSSEWPETFPPGRCHAVVLLDDNIIEVARGTVFGPLFMQLREFSACLIPITRQVRLVGDTETEFELDVRVAAHFLEVLVTRYFLPRRQLSRVQLLKQVLAEFVAHLLLFSDRQINHGINFRLQSICFKINCVQSNWLIAAFDCDSVDLAANLLELSRHEVTKLS